MGTGFDSISAKISKANNLAAAAAFSTVAPPGCTLVQMNKFSNQKWLRGYKAIE